MAHSLSSIIIGLPAGTSTLDPVGYISTIWNEQPEAIASDLGLKPLMRMSGKYGTPFTPLAPCPKHTEQSAPNLVRGCRSPVCDGITALANIALASNNPPSSNAFDSLLNGAFDSNGPLTNIDFRHRSLGNDFMSNGSSTIDLHRNGSLSNGAFGSYEPLAGVDFGCESLTNGASGNGTLGRLTQGDSDRSYQDVKCGVDLSEFTEFNLPEFEGVDLSALTGSTTAANVFTTC
ncbi:hypothetical protein GMORB2_4949 [Geosmithia morbida]|uniref:Uncharacterized protein n=1 Tax=Geosmithia morbida TaxID=1094350 RepID=A0A9P5CYC9_9HYPO|nr:uncharacterized protein GMORB2_4949 [Geosmithia morbida]KAF4119252.1 hypothetical protein GMORB2_4949 [Geosmithia morbida]